MLLEGRSRVSEVIKLITQSTWSRADFYIGRLHDLEDPLLRDTLLQHYAGTPDTQVIIESELGEGTIVKPLTTYEKEHLRICRPRGLDYEDSQKKFAIVSADWAAATMCTRSSTWLDFFPLVYHAATLTLKSI